MPLCIAQPIDDLYGYYNTNTAIKMNALTHILHHKIVAIIRGISPAYLQSVALALYKGGIRTLEITLNSEKALQGISTLKMAMATDMLIGAGTVLNAEDAAAAIQAGASFIISPIVDAETIKLTRKMGAVSIPGAFTATEIYHAFSLGGQIIKVFPAVNGPAYIKDILAPLPQIPLMPTGGISLENIGDFQQSGAVAFGIGSALVNPKPAITDAYLSQLTAKAAQFTMAVLPKNFTAKNH